MPLPLKPLQLLASEPKLQGRSRKRLYIENKIEQDRSVNIDTLHHNESTIRTEVLHNQFIPKLKTDLDRTSSENFEVLVISIREFAKSIIENSSKMREPKTYDEAISNLVYGNI